MVISKYMVPRNRALDVVTKTTRRGRENSPNRILSYNNMETQNNKDHNVDIKPYTLLLTFSS